MKRKDFLSQAPQCNLIGGYFCIYICRKILSPLITPWFVNHNVRPNTVTLLMIITGFLTGFVLMLPFLWTKALCFFLYYLWFAFDCSDGEVARITNKCSDYGKLLDWIAHLLCHPMFIIGMWFSINQFYEIHYPIIITVVSMGLISAELILRMLVAFRHYMPESTYHGVMKLPDTNILFIRILITLKEQLGYFPNAVIFCPLIMFIDIALDIKCFHYVFYIWAILYILNVFKQLVAVISYMYKK